MIPAGAEIVKLRKYPTQNLITFKELPGRNKIKLHFNPDVYTNLSLDDYSERLFTFESFDQLIQDFTELEVECISKGIVRTGISRGAVLISWGYPPETLTVDIEADEWIYWKDPANKQFISFNQNGIVTRVK